MKRIQTKEQRNTILASIKESKLKSGYNLEIFEGLQIFTKYVDENKRFYLEVYKDNSTKPILNYYYTNEALMLKRIEDTKKSYVLRNEYKEKRKSEQKGRLTGAAACADAIRAELKKEFPCVKFSVRSSTFSMGDSVHISWSDGPTVKEVEQFTGKYQYGDFNGMEDIYENSNTIEGLPQAKFVSEDRKMSEEAGTILNPIAANLFESLKTSNENRPFNCWDSAQFLYQIFNACSFPNGAKPVNIVATGLSCGLNSASEFYKIEFDSTEVKEVKKSTQTEVKNGSINIIEYGKGIAVIGDTYPVKENLKAIGGKWNKFLSCGAGWVFSSDKLEEIKAMILKVKESKEQKGEATEPKQVLMIEENINTIQTPQNNPFKLESFRIIWHEGKQTPNFENRTFTNWEEIQSAFYQIWDANERGGDFGYTKVKCDLKLVGEDSQIFRIDVTNKTNNGDFNPSEKHIISYLIELQGEEEQTQPIPQKEVKIVSLFDYQTAQQRLSIN